MAKRIKRVFYTRPPRDENTGKRTGVGVRLGKDKGWILGGVEGYIYVIGLPLMVILGLFCWANSCNSTPAQQPPAVIGTAPATQQLQPPVVVGAPTVVCCSPSSPTNNTIIMGQQSIALPSGVLVPTGIVSMGGDRTIIIIPERR